jgi:hypothetical protein
VAHFGVRLAPPTKGQQLASNKLTTSNKLH